MFRSSHLLLAMTVVMALVATTTEARADKWTETFEIAAQVEGGWFETDELTLSAAPADPGPALLEGADLRLAGSGGFVGGGVRSGVIIEGWRFGVGVGFLSGSGMTLRGNLPSQLSRLEAGGLWGMPFDLYAGYAFETSYDAIRPYLEARGSLTVLQTQLEAHSAELGSLGATLYNAYAPGFAVRAGLLVPLSHYFYLDVGAGYDVLGPRRAAAAVAIGLPVPMSHMF